MPRTYHRCAECRRLGTSSELIGCCNNAGLATAHVTRRQAEHLDRQALRRHVEAKRIKTERFGKLRAWWRSVLTNLRAPR